MEANQTIVSQPSPSEASRTQNGEKAPSRSESDTKERQFLSLNIDSEILRKNNKQFVTLNVANVSSSASDRTKPVLVLTNGSGNVMIDSQSLSRLAYLQGIQGILSDTQEKISKEINTTAQQSDDDKSGQRFKLFPCGDCDRQFSSEAYLKLHRNTHSGQKMLKCDYEGCDKKFVWPAHHKYHLLTHQNKRPYKCPQCDNCFYTSQRLQVHQRTHTGEKPYTCGNCEKSFTTAGNLQNHMRTHTGERPFACSEPGCSRKFAEKSSLKKHTLTHTGNKPFSCDVCGKAFSQIGSRNVHKRKHLLEKTQNEKKKQESIHSFIQGQHDLQQNVLVLRQEDDMLLYHDFQGSESVVYSHDGMNDVQVVTVTTRPMEGEGDQLKYRPIMLGSDEAFHTTDAATISTTTASVVVLSQPQEIVSMATGFHHNPQTTVEEIVYDGDIMSGDLDHEEITGNISTREYEAGTSHSKDE